MRQLQLAMLVVIACLGSCVPAGADCPPWRPCGPGNSWGGNHLVPQGFYGADFRYACANHDECYKSCANRKDCDRQFLHNMQCACDCSANPRACYRKAKCYYMAARLLGGVYRLHSN